MSPAFRLADQRLLAAICGTGELLLEPLPESGWEGVVQSAVKHGVGPLLYKRLILGTPPPVPQPVLDRLREMYLVNAARNVLLYQHLGEVLRRLPQEGIPVMPLKGTYLGALVYEDVAARKMGDADLLVRRSHLVKAAAKLVAMGYTCEISADAAVVEAWSAAHPDAHHLPPFYRPPDTRIELHWSILDRPDRTDLADPWTKARPAIIAGVETLVMAPEDLMLHLCMHAEQHKFQQGLRPLCDIAAVVQHYAHELDWAQLGSQAAAWHAGKCVHLGLWLSREMLNAPVPEDFLRDLQPPDFSANLALLAQEIALSGEELFREEASALQPWSAYMEQRGKRGVWETIFPSREHMMRYMAIKHRPPPTGLRRYTCYGTRALDIAKRILGLGWFWMRRRSRALDGAREMRRTTQLKKWLTAEDPADHRLKLEI